MANMGELQWRLSGGASNSDPDASLGGVMSSTRILSQTATRATALIAGVTIEDASGNGLGDGTLSFVASSSTLSWAPSGGAQGTAVDITLDGDYYIQGASDGGALYVAVVAIDLPGSNTSDTVTIANIANLIYDDVTKVQSDAGITEYRMVWLNNIGTVATTDDKKTVKVWINANTPGQDNIAIAIADEVASDGTGTPGTPPCPELVGSEITAPSSPALTFTAPITEATALTIGDLTSSSGSTNARGLWIRRLVPAGVDAKEDNNTWSLSISAKV